MRVRAIAIASEHSNLVGTVELDCTVQGLSLTYVDAARVGAEGVPIAFERWQQVCIAWTSVRRARRLGSSLALDFELSSGDAQQCVLVHFSTGNDVTWQELRQRRWLLRFWGIGISVVLASAAALTAPRFVPTIGPLMGLLAGVTFAAILMALGAKAERFLSDGGRQSKVLGDLFVNDLLAYVPHIPQEPFIRTAKSFSFPRFDGILPRTTLAISLTLAGALLAALVMFRWIVTVHPNSPDQTGPQFPNVVRPANVLPAASGEVPSHPAAPIAATKTNDQSQTPATSTVSIPAAGVARTTGPCECQRADSLLWSQPLPRVSLIVMSSRRYRRHEHEHVELEFAAINNSDRDISEVTSMAEFFQQDPPPSSKLVSVSTRAVYYQGPLHPGEAIKWHVDAEGTTFRLHPPMENNALVSGILDEHGGNAAPTNAIARLLKAHNRPVRLHGAMLLAFLRDPRAREATVELGDSLRETESSYLRRLLEALSELRMCQVQVSGNGSQRRVLACVFNTTDTPRTPVEVVVRALDATVSADDPVGAPPQILAEKSVILPGSIPAKSGVFSQIEVDFTGIDRTPAAFETMAQVAAAH
jgi:hypothetical protein